MLMEIERNIQLKANMMQKRTAQKQDPQGDKMQEEKDESVQNKVQLLKDNGAIALSQHSGSL